MTEARGGSGPAGATPDLRRSRVYSSVLILLVILFCAVTRWGRGYPTFLHRTWILWSSGRSLPDEARRISGYDSTYPIALYLKENTPPDAVILLPPKQLISDQTEKAAPTDIPILASPSSVYNFIYPRVPVHWGDPSPWKGKINYLLVWNWWGLDLVQPGVPHTEENRIQIFPWPAGVKAPW